MWLWVTQLTTDRTLFARELVTMGTLIALRCFMADTWQWSSSDEPKWICPWQLSMHFVPRTWSQKQLWSRSQLFSMALIPSALTWLSSHRGLPSHRPKQFLKAAAPTNKESKVTTLSSYLSSKTCHTSNMFSSLANQMTDLIQICHTVVRWTGH